MSSILDKQQAIFFRDEFRKARVFALENAEGFQEILFALERLGSVLLQRTATLGAYEGHIKILAQKSALSKIENSYHSSFDTLYNHVRDARNGALHQGAVARHLTENAIKLALILEDAIQKDVNLSEIQDFMIWNPVCADLWKPLSFIRQKFLANSFSYLPFQVENEWFLISDFSVAEYIYDNRIKLSERFEDAIKNELKYEESVKCLKTTQIEEVLRDFQGKPILVFDTEEYKNLIGIITSFDIL